MAAVMNVLKRSLTVSIVRGAVSQPSFYPYPFYRPDFFWTMFFGDRPLQTESRL